MIDGRDGVKRLSQLSTIVGNMKAVNRHRVYVRMSDREGAARIAADLRKERSVQTND